MNKLKRYVIFLIGLFVNSLGVSLITKASLGTSPISSIPYVLSLSFPFTLGNFTIFFSIFLILLQLLILRKNFKLEHVLQIPVSIIFGYFIDLTMMETGICNTCSSLKFLRKIKSCMKIRNILKNIVKFPSVNGKLRLGTIMELMKLGDVACFGDQADTKRVHKKPPIRKITYHFFFVSSFVTFLFPCMFHSLSQTGSYKFYDKPP